MENVILVPREGEEHTVKACLVHGHNSEIILLFSPEGPGSCRVREFVLVPHRERVVAHCDIEQFIDEIDELYAGHDLIDSKIVPSFNT